MRIAILTGFAGFTAALATLATPALAQKPAADSYPFKPISIVIPFAAGGSTDGEARLYTDKVGPSLGQQMVFDFRPGAASSIGMIHVLKSAPDGYTLLMANSSSSVFPHFYPAVNENVARTLEPITQLSNRLTIAVVSPAALPNVHTLAELQAYGKANPGKLNCNTSGSGSITHTVCAAMAGELKVPIKAIHYKGVVQGQIDLVAGRVQVSAGTLFSGLPQIRQGRLRAVATLNTERSTQLPDLRTSHEQGFNIDFPSWIGLFAPPGTRREIITRLNAEFVKAVRSPDVLKALDAQGSLPIASSPEEFRKKFAGELAYWKRIIQENNITLEE